MKHGMMLVKWSNEELIIKKELFAWPLQDRDRFLKPFWESWKVTKYYWLFNKFYRCLLIKFDHFHKQLRLSFLPWV